jgi:hypothetical protein
MENNLAGNYYLTQDIDASATSGWNGGAGFVPITSFTGTLDGNGYKITGMYQNRNDLGGLFYVMESGSVVKDLTLEDCVILGNSGGCFAGYVTPTNADHVKIYNCHVTGTSSMSAFAGVAGMGDAGGFVGLVSCNSTDEIAYFYDCTTNATVDFDGGHTDNSLDEFGGFAGTAGGGTYVFNNCRATGNVDVVSANNGGGGEVVGGFIGYSGGAGGSFTDCAATGDVTSENSVGGFAGQISNGICTRCSARGNVVGTDESSGTYVGGFTSELATTSPSMTDCYAWGDVNGTTGYGNTGGLCSTLRDGTVTNCYAIGALVGDTSGFWGGVGGFSYYTRDITVSACFWDTETTGEADGFGWDVSGNTGTPTGHTTENMQTQSTYTDAGWDFDSVWEMDSEYVSPDITTTKIKFVKPFPYEIETGDRYCINGVPFYARCWPLQIEGVSKFNRWDVVGAALKCRKLSGFDSNDNAYWRVSMYRGVKQQLEDEDVYIGVDQNPADSAGALNVDGVDLEPYIEQIAAGVTFELTDAEFNIGWTDSRRINT